MRKMILSLCGLASICVASAQFSVGANGNFTKYGGDLSRSTTGFGVRASYEADRVGGYLAFTNGFPITEKGTTVVYNNSTGASKTVAAEGKLNFKTFTLMGTRTLIGDAETAGKFYFGFGASFVLLKYSESITESYDKNAYGTPDMGSESQNGFTINALLGGEYKIGKPSIFAEGGIAFPANKVGDSYVENSIPAHMMINVGIKLPLTGDN